uniref:Serine hydrolase n=1 Tax=Hirondellea gigas TaxID=1518452 RepID=A0A2P2IC40_9CRUS
MSNGSPYKSSKTTEDQGNVKVAWMPTNSGDETETCCSNATNHSTSADTGHFTCDWQEIEIETSWGTIRGKKCGSGSRKILGVHGWLDNANTFDFLLPLLHSTYTFISIDLPGHGKSDHFTQGFIYDPRGYVGAIRKAVTALGWNKFTYLGHSMGSVVGIMYVAIFPESIDSFISIDIIKPTSQQPANYSKSYRRYFDSYFNNEHNSTLTPLVYSKKELISKTIAGSGQSLDAASAALLLERGAVLSGDAGEGYLLTRDLRAKSYFIGFTPFEAWLAMAQAITCPVLIIKAKSGHSYDTKERNEAMLAAFEHGSQLYSYHELEGKHHVHMTHPGSVAAVLQPFLQQTHAAVDMEANCTATTS